MALNREEKSESKATLPAKRSLPWFALGIAATLAVMVVPSTRQIVRSEVMAVPLMVQSALHSGVDPFNDVVTRSTPNYYSANHVDACVLGIGKVQQGVRTANPTDSTPKPTSPEVVAKLDEASAPCADVPAVQAMLLSHLSGNDIELAREEEQKYLARPGKPPAATKPVASGVNSDATLTRMLRAAELGEIRDPDNAYFPTMLALYYLIKRQDADAFEALHRAAEKPHFNDYGWAYADARTRLLAESPVGALPSMSRASIYMAVLFPQYAKLRSLARTSIALAMQKEINGDHTGGIAIRHDLARIGAKMRVESRSAIGSLVGIAITAIAGGRPDGVASVESTKIKTDERVAKNLSTYITYLNKNGNSDEATWFLAERKKADQAKMVLQAGLERYMEQIRWMAAGTILWLGTGVLLLKAVSALIFGAIAAWVLRGTVPGNRPRFTPTGWVSVAVGILILALMGGVIGGLIEGLLKSLVTLQGTQTDAYTVPLFGPLVFALWLPAMNIIGIAAPIRRKNRPSDTLVERLDKERRVALPRAGKILLACAVCTALAAGVEDYNNKQITRQITSEGRYYAEITGQQWPGPVEMAATAK